MILDSKTVKYDIVDIAEPENDELKDFMQNKSTSKGGTVSDPDPRHPLPPQIFNDEEYCGVRQMNAISTPICHNLTSTYLIMCILDCCVRKP